MAHKDHTRGRFRVAMTGLRCVPSSRAALPRPAACVCDAERVKMGLRAERTPRRRRASRTAFLATVGVSVALSALSPAARASVDPGADLKTCFWADMAGKGDGVANVMMPDAAATYWYTTVTLPPGGKVVLRGDFPHARTFFSGTTTSSTPVTGSTTSRSFLTKGRRIRLSRAPIAPSATDAIRSPSPVSRRPTAAAPPTRSTPAHPDRLHNPRT